MQNCNILLFVALMNVFYLLTVGRHRDAKRRRVSHVQWLLLQESLTGMPFLMSINTNYMTCACVQLK